MQVGVSSSKSKKEKTKEEEEEEEVGRGGKREKIDYILFLMIWHQ